MYLDGGHSAWNSATEPANRLRAAGVQFADGFFTNVSNFNSTSDEANYGRAVISALNGMGVSGKRQVIDTSRNGGASGRLVRRRQHRPAHRAVPDDEHR